MRLDAGEGCFQSALTYRQEALTLGPRVSMESVEAHMNAIYTTDEGLLAYKQRLVRWSELCNELRTTPETETRHELAERAMRCLHAAEALAKESREDFGPYTATLYDESVCRAVALITISYIILREQLMDHVNGIVIKAARSGKLSSPTLTNRKQ